MTFTALRPVISPISFGAFILFVSLNSALAFSFRDSLTTILVVRHAERDTHRVDPPLSAWGKERARVLAMTLSKANIVAAFATDYRRTQQTIEPLSEDLGLERHIIVVEGRDLNAHVAELMQIIEQRYVGKTVLIASHSNVVPLILRALGIDAGGDIPSHQYDDLFIVTRSQSGASKLVHLKYGRPTP